MSLCNNKFSRIARYAGHPGTYTILIDAVDNDILLDVMFFPLVYGNWQSLLFMLTSLLLQNVKDKSNTKHVELI